MTAAPAPVLGCVDIADGGNDHQLQLWIEQNPGGYAFVIRSQYQPGQRIARRCALDSGPTDPQYDAVLAAGKAALARLKMPATPSESTEPTQSSEPTQSTEPALVRT